MNEEGLKKTANKMIFIGKPIDFDVDVFEEQLEQLKEYVVQEPCDIREHVKAMVPTYVPKED